MTALFNLDARRTRLILDVLTGLAILSVAVALAGLTWRIGGHVSTGAITVPGGARPPAPITDLSPAIAAAPFGKPRVDEAGQPTSIAAILKGVIFAQPSTLSSAFVQIGDQPVTTVAIGDALEGATITAIQRDRIILNNGGRAEYLALPDPFAPTGKAAEDAAAAKAAPPAAANGASPIVQAPPQPQAAPQADDGLAPVSLTPAAEAVIARLGAVSTRGGYRIGGNSVPGLLAGDVLQSVNNTSLGDAAAVNSAFAAAAASGTANIQILRDGKIMTVTVPLR